jgi:hypothetical protein
MPSGTGGVRVAIDETWEAAEDWLRQTTTERRADQA